MEMKYKIGEDIMVLADKKLHQIVAIDSEAGWYRLSGDDKHYTEDQIASLDEVLYTLIIHDFDESNDFMHSCIVFKDFYKAMNYMQDLFKGFDEPETEGTEWIKHYEEGVYFSIWDSYNPSKQYSCDLRTVKITD